MKDVSFTYVGSEKPALEHVSFDIPRGKTVALVGRSGSGKSTIANLFNRFYDVDSGSITLDGRDIRDYELKNLRE
ncbi:ATP-binding cassette domain-containing protein, partial [Campylobacter jejuni]|uniref:ATP-binding cassette domain-containing protein n=1 Tax=Campylobacter jejuni TaxID=197 RepID=UPI00352A8864